MTYWVLCATNTNIFGFEKSSEYEYEYYSVCQYLPNTNTNITIRSQLFEYYSNTELFAHLCCEMMSTSLFSHSSHLFPLWVFPPVSTVVSMRWYNGTKAFSLLDYVVPSKKTATDHILWVGDAEEPVDLLFPISNFVYFLSPDRSSLRDDVLLYIQQTATFWDFEHACLFI